MADEIFSPTSNHAKGAPMGGVSSAEDGDQIVLRVNPITKRLLIDGVVSVSGVEDGEGDSIISDTYDAMQVSVVNEAGYSQKITEVGAITYIATAIPGSVESDSVWRVKKIDCSVAGLTIFTWADGNDNYDNEATDLTALTYS